MPDPVKPPAVSLPVPAVGIAPYENAIIAICRVIEKAMDGQPAEVRVELWKLFLDDLRNFRGFFQGIGDFFKPKAE